MKASNGAGTITARALALVAAAALVACTEAAPPPRTAQPTSAPATLEPPPAMGVFRSKRFGLDLELYDGTAWKIDDRSTHWLSASHPEGSSLLVRTWRAENRMNRDKCEAQARNFRRLPSAESVEIVDERAFDVPPGFDTRATVGLMPSREGSIFGMVLAFGGSGRRCFAFVYATQATGPRATEIVADRLAKTTEGALGKLAFRRDFEPPLERDAGEPETDQR